MRREGEGGEGKNDGGDEEGSTVMLETEVQHVT